MTVFSPQNPVYPELSNPASDPYGNFVPSADQSQPAQGGSLWDNILGGAKFMLPNVQLPGMPGGIGSPIPNTLSDNSVSSFFGKLVDPSTWERVGMIVVGIVFLIIGLYMLADRKIDITNVVASGKALAA